MKIIGEDTYHRPAIGDVQVCAGIQSEATAKIICNALQRELGDRECRTYKIVSDGHALYTPN